MTMTLHEIQAQALQLSLQDRWQLIDALMHSVRPQYPVKPEGLAASLIGLAKTDSPPPTDEEVKAILAERLVRKYL